MTDPRRPRLALAKEDLVDELELVRLPRPGAVLVFKEPRDRATVAAPAAPVILATNIQPTVIAARLEPAPRVYSEETRVLSRAELDRHMDDDFVDVMGSVSVAPAAGGGFQITRLDPRSYVASLGFREGDVVRSVAGDRPSTTEDAARVYAPLRTLSAFTAEVDRAGTQLYLRFEIKGRN